MQARLLRRAPTPFAGDDLVGAVFRRAHDDRLNDAALFDRVGELVQLGVGERCVRGLRGFGFRLSTGARRGLRPLSVVGVIIADVADQRGQPASQSFVLRHRRRS